MPMDQLATADGLVHQESGAPLATPILFLPGVHGDWTPQLAARPLLNREFRFIETAYPRIATWSMDDFARALKQLLDDLGIESAHIVAESFGSLILWQFGLTHPKRVRSGTLLGGFSRPPRFRGAAAASVALRAMPTSLLESIIDIYVARRTALGEKRDCFEMGAYPAARTRQGRYATANRLVMIQTSDFRNRLREVEFPVRYLGGARDIVVPVRREIATLRAQLPPDCDFRSELVAGAPHAMIPSHAEEIVRHLRRWIHEIEAETSGEASSADQATGGIGPSGVP